MVLKMTGLSSRFQRKNRFWKICNGSWDIVQNVSKYTGLVWRPYFWHILLNISGPGAYFSKPIFALKPWAQAGHFEYHEAYKQNKILLSYKGSCRFLKSLTPQLKPLQIKNFNDFPKTYMIYPNNYYQPNCKCDFFNVQPTLLIMHPVRNFNQCLSRGVH